MEVKDIVSLMFSDNNQGLKNLLDLVPNNIYIKDKDLLYVWVNQEHMKSLGVDKPEDVIKRRDSDFFPQDYAIISKGRDTHVIDSGSSSQEDVEIVMGANGKYRTYMVARIPITSSGEIIGLLGIWTDISNLNQDMTSRMIKDLDQQKKDELFFEDLFENSTAMASITQPDGKIVRMNKKAIEMFFGSKETYNSSAEGTNIIDLVYKDDKFKAMRLWKKCIRTKKEVTYRVRMMTIDKRIMHLLISGKPILINGKVVYFQYQALDMIDQKVHEQNLLQTASAETMAQLVGGIAHDFNNLFTAINGYAQMLKSAVDEDHPFYQKVSQICKAGNKASILTQKILQFSRSHRTKPKIIDINDELSNQEAVINHVIEKDIHLIFNKKEGLDKIKIDPTQFSKIIINLIINAKEAMPKGGDITIKTGDVYIDESNINNYSGLSFGKHIFISVADTGEGMDEELKKHILEPFFSAQTSDQGIGLWTVGSIVKYAGGIVLVESSIGKGTTFTAVFPVAVDQKDTSDHASLKEPESQTIETKTIFVVEDDDTVRELVKEILSQQGHKILTARNGGDALQIARNYNDHVDLLITDIVMRRIDGKMLSDRMKSIWPHVKVMYMSGYTDDVIKHGEIKDVEFLQKPFLPSDLLDRVNHILTKGG